ncbi:uncharacterized protein LOC128745334 [Sabethes cyaneus]|uniref:uncharacterized protein LOC128745334 n=1 Tax=Sabethes cyaneus TaxID=53552 RepID=UPI00237D5824|nr:uncharacterized protein LOC128745334 [Sabethes cyaneus]
METEETSAVKEQTDPPSALPVKAEDEPPAIKVEELMINDTLEANEDEQPSTVDESPDCSGVVKQESAKDGIEVGKTEASEMGPATVTDANGKVANSSASDCESTGNHPPPDQPTAGKKKKKAYSERDLETSVVAVRDKIMSLTQAAAKYGIPKTTIYFRLKKESTGKSRYGPTTVLSSEEEQKISAWLHETAKRGFPCTPRALFSTVKAFLDSAGRKTPFKDNLPSYTWLESFMKRCSDEARQFIRKPDAVARAAAHVSKQDIVSWFKGTASYLEEKQLSDILIDPRRILSAAETSFECSHATKEVLVEKVTRNECLVQETADPTKNVTVLFTFSADGHMFPSAVTVPFRRLTKNLLQSFPDDWSLGKSARGWMDSENFIAYVHNTLHPELIARNVPLPVICFLDGHSSPTGIDAAVACAALGIILIALFPNASRLLQSCDVAIFNPLKNQWPTVIADWKMKNGETFFTVEQFGGALQKTIQCSITPSVVQSGFRNSGLYPFDENAIDYSRCVTDSELNGDHFQTFLK